MTTIIAYRYDNHRYEAGDIITSRGDSFDSLTPIEKMVEPVLREILPDGHAIRGGSVFAWEDEAVGKRLWRLSGKQYLYKLEILKTDIRLRGDLNHYNNAKDAAKAGLPFDQHLEAYRDGQPSPQNGLPRVELMFSKAKVLERYE